MNKKYIYIVPLLFFSYSIYASNSKIVSSKLAELRLTPTISHNANLLANIEIEYGKKFRDILVKEHPYLIGNPAGKIDLKTLEWVAYTGFSKLFSPAAIFSFSPFLSVDHGANVFLNDLLFRGYPLMLSRPAFLSKEQLEATRSTFYDNGKYGIVLPIFMTQYPQMHEMSALEVVEGIYHRVFIDKYYIIGSGLSGINGANVSILGHGASGGESLQCSTLLVNYAEIIQIIKSSGIPGDVNIRLQSCHTGNGTSNLINTGKTKEELKELFIKRKIKTLMGDEKKSYGYKFAKEIYNVWPEFTGKVKGYYGFSYSKIFYGYTRDPSNPNKLLFKELNPVSLLDLNNEYVKFDSAEMAYEYKRQDFEY